MKTGLIYIIKNDLNNKVYIGQTTTTTIECRFSEHCKPSTLKTRQYKIHNAIKKYGKNHFYCELLEDQIPIELLNDKEIEYIEKYNSYNCGYNSTKGGDGRTINKDYDEEQIIKLYNQGKSSSEIAKLYNVSGATISRCLNRLHIQTRKGGNKYTTFDTKKFIKMWKTKEILIKDMAIYFNVNEKTIRRNAKRLNLNKKRCRD